jgi:hypothetical protein
MPQIFTSLLGETSPGAECHAAAEAETSAKANNPAKLYSQPQLFSHIFTVIAVPAGKRMKAAQDRRIAAYGNSTYSKLPKLND